MKTSVISKEFRERYLSNPKDPEAFEGKAIVFDGPEDYHAPHRRSRRSASTSNTMLFMRGAGPIGYPGAAEVVNMQPPATSSSAASRACPASATAASPARRARPRSSTPRRKRRRRRARVAQDRRPVRIDLNRAPPTS
jgi:dihydroxy-acid dehydratase